MFFFSYFFFCSRHHRYSSFLKSSWCGCFFVKNIKIKNDFTEKNFYMCVLSFYDRTNLANSDSKWASRSWTPPFEALPPPPKVAKAEKGWGCETDDGWPLRPTPIWPRFSANPGGGVLDITGEGWPQWWPPSWGGGGPPGGCCCPPWPPPPRPRPARPGISPAALLLVTPLRPLNRPPPIPEDCGFKSPVDVNWSKLLLSHPGGESALKPARLWERLSATCPVTMAGSSVVQSLACGDLMLFQPAK